MRAFRASLLALILALAVAAPVSAAPPERFEEPIFFIFPDLNYGLAVFWNITRDDFCAWQESDFDGPPPVTRLVNVQFNETANGAVVVRWAATSSLELWALDADADLSGPCPDTDDSSAPWAAGSAHVKSNDNDLFVSGSRTNSFGDSGKGTVTDAAGGSWHYSWTFHALIDRDFEFRAVVERSLLKQRGR
ncbi:hypothetical protein BH24CHL6_BH24CHL6_00030 [soil metagenome]